MAGELIDIVIVSYGGRNLLRRDLESLRAHLPAGMATVTVVDNAGPGGVAALVSSEFEEFSLLEQARNLGFAAASNIGIRAGSAPYVLILNPDAAIEEGTMTPLLDLLDSDPKVGCVGPELIRDDGSLDHAARRSFPTVLSALGHFSGIGRRMRGGRLAAYRAPDIDRGPVDAVNGAFMLLRREALEEVGLFDEGYWMYMEDLDLCYRLDQAGWTTFYESRSRARHTKAGTTAGRRDLRLNVAFHRGMGRFYRRHYAPGHNPAMNALVYVGIGAKLLMTLLAEALGGLRNDRSSSGADAG
jgi:N-acetylglucosaminyl-diphospho-decaprenol L-rhamnosyltransferase